jgi:hypothetical protein
LQLKNPDQSLWKTERHNQALRPPTLKKKMRILREISDNVRQTILAGSGKASSSVQAKPNNRKPGSESLPPTF